MAAQFAPTAPCAILGGALHPAPECAAAQQSRPTTRPLRWRTRMVQCAAPPSPWRGCAGTLPAAAVGEDHRFRQSAAIRRGWPPANPATVTGRNGCPGRPGQSPPANGHDTIEGGSTQVAGSSAPAWSAGARCPLSDFARDDDRSEHTYGGPSGRRCGTLLLYPLFELFDLGFW